MKKTFHELQDETLIAEAGGDMCSVPLEKLRSKAMIAIHKKKCVDPKHWSNTKGKAPKDSAIQRAARRAGMTAGKRRGLYNSTEEGYQQTSNLVDISQEVMAKMIKAMKKDDFRTAMKLYKELGNIIK